MNQKGFSLIELMIVVVIIGIIASIAVPGYQNSVMRSSRGDGMTALLDIMRAQENFFANEYTYTTNLTQLNYNAAQASSSGKYIITAQQCGSDSLEACVMLVATAQGGQAVDGNLTLNSRGERTHNGAVGWPK